jgi:hypothetical protein
MPGRVMGWMLAVFAAASLLGLTSPVAAGSSSDPDPTHGEWEIQRSQDSGDDQVQLRLHHEWHNGSGTHNHSSSFDVARDQLGISRADWQAGRANVAFDLTRDAGTVHLKGTLQHGVGSGEYEFEANPRFRDELSRAGIRNVEDEDLMRLAIHDIDRSWVRGFAGRDLTVDDLVRFKVHDVSPEFVRAMSTGGYRDLTGDDLVRFKVHGVEPRFVQELGDLGYDRPSPDDLIRLGARHEPSYTASRWPSPAQTLGGRRDPPARPWRGGPVRARFARPASLTPPPTIWYGSRWRDAGAGEALSRATAT